MDMRRNPEAEQKKRAAEQEQRGKYYSDKLRQEKEFHAWIREGLDAEAIKKKKTEQDNSALSMSSKYFPPKLTEGIYTVEGVEIKVKTQAGTRTEPLRFLVEKDPNTGDISISALQIPANDEDFLTQARELSRGLAIGGENRIVFGFKGLKPKEIDLRELQLIEKMLDQAIKDGIAVRLDSVIMQRLAMSPNSLIHQNPFSLRTLKAAFSGDSEAAIIARILQKQDLSQKKVRENKQLQGLKGKVEANAKYEKNKETLEKDVKQLEKARTDLDDILKRKGTDEEVKKGIVALTTAIDKVNDDFKEIQTELNSTNSQSLDKNLIENYKLSVENAKKTIDKAKISDVLQSEDMKKVNGVETELKAAQSSLETLNNSSNGLVEKLEAETNPEKRAGVYAEEFKENLTAVEEGVKAVETAMKEVEQAKAEVGKGETPENKKILAEKEKQLEEKLKGLETAMEGMDSKMTLIRDDVNREGVSYDSLTTYNNIFSENPDSSEKPLWERMDKVKEDVGALQTTHSGILEGPAKDQFDKVTKSTEKVSDNFDNMSSEIENVRQDKQTETLMTKPK